MASNMQRHSSGFPKSTSELENIFSRENYHGSLSGSIMNSIMSSVPPEDMPSQGSHTIAGVNNTQSNANVKEDAIAPSPKSQLAAKEVDASLDQE
jgi:hypothetical protein